MPHKKPNLPTKVCIACHRPFAWRKKWLRDWEAVKFCSDRCRRNGRAPDVATRTDVDTPSSKKVCVA